MRQVLNVAYSWLTQHRDQAGIAKIDAILAGTKEIDPKVAARQNRQALAGLAAFGFKPGTKG